MNPLMNEGRLHQENTAHAGTGGVSGGNAGLGFRPAFLDSATFSIYPSCFADGRPAPFYTRLAAARACAEWRPD